MRRFSWPTMLFFVMSLLLAVILLGLGTAHLSKLKQQRRQPSDSSLLLREHRVELATWADIPAPALRVSSDAADGFGKLSPMRQ